MPSPANVYDVWVADDWAVILSEDGQAGDEIEPQLETTRQVPTMLPPHAVNGSHEIPFTAASTFVPAPPPLPHAEVATHRTKMTKPRSPSHHDLQSEVISRFYARTLTFDT